MATGKGKVISWSLQKLDPGRVVWMRVGGDEGEKQEEKEGGGDGEGGWSALEAFECEEEENYKF